MFPAQDYGCERCGAHGAALQRVELCARGTISSWATVHVHTPRPTPLYTVVEVRLDAGPLIRGLLEPGGQFKAGTRVEGVSRVVPDDATANTPSDILVFAHTRSDP